MLTWSMLPPVVPGSHTLHLKDNSLWERERRYWRGSSPKPWSCPSEHGAGQVKVTKLWTNSQHQSSFPSQLMMRNRGAAGHGPGDWAWLPPAGRVTPGDSSLLEARVLWLVCWGRDPGLATPSHWAWSWAAGPPCSPLPIAAFQLHTRERRGAETPSLLLLHLGSGSGASHLRHPLPCASRRGRGRRLPRRGGRREHCLHGALMGWSRQAQALCSQQWQDQKSMRQRQPHRILWGHYS